MKNLLKIVGVMLLLWGNTSLLLGQAKVQEISLQKGEVFDILLLTQNADTEADLKSYFQTAFPVAKRMSYQSLPGFKVTDHTQGNLRPNNLILGKWENLETREAFLTQIVEEVPDFHERRRTIWSYVGLRYFEMKEDVTFRINRGKYQVATAFWLTLADADSKFYKKWEREMQKAGAQVLIRLKDGKSPFAYQYNPDLFIITEWESEAAFNKFQERTRKLKLDNIQHVNEFILK